tara:strand:+ start:1397 stop:2041 length:645 start_codon:yes stop_codon:yes gene_type:complete
MKVKVKQDGKIKQFKLINSWSDVSMDTWLKLIEFETGSKTKEAEETIAALSDMSKQLINQLSLRDVAVIMEKIAELQAAEDSSLKRIIEIEGVEYGFHPNLDEITLGEYADLETFIKNGVEQHLPEVMAVLYRKVTEKTDSGVYTIEAYGGDLTIRAEQMKKMSAEQVQSALRFFFAFVNDLSMILQLSLTEKLKEMKEQLPQNPSQKNGDGLE